MPTPAEPRLGGFLEDASKYLVEHGDDIATVAEVVVPLIAPYAAPVVAAEHALRTGMRLSQNQAKAATTGATQVGQAVADHVADQGEVGELHTVAPKILASSEVTSRTTRASEDLADPAGAQKRAPQPKSSSNGLVIVGAVIFGLMLLGME
jgi:hypothetical protein